MYISLIIPVYNRPQETEELLASLALQIRSDFEVVLVEDGSSPELSSEAVADAYRNRLRIRYVWQPNGGPAAARNTGAAHASGDFFIIMDSDCIVPPDYFARVYAALAGGDIRFFGGPDSAGDDFSPLQKAVSYSMTSLFTTGGIRGNRRTVSKYSPRSFNLGIDRSLFEQVGGFSDMRIGEDIDFSLRVMATGVQAVFLPEAVVCHKRRTSLKLFFKQVFVFGTARVNLNIRHPRSRKAVYLLPALFTLGSAALTVAAIVWNPLLIVAFLAVVLLWRYGGVTTAGGAFLILFVVLYGPWWYSVPFCALMLLWLVDAARRNRSLYIGWLAVWTSFIQLYGYGLGFLYGTWQRRIRRREEAYTYRVTKFFSQKTR